ncbi:hypothetical protein JX266_005401 [Neoarthrinium moseri]|nr:hypothetical protein JX266_005401 [Neoarthrinium moseri]
MPPKILVLAGAPDNKTLNWESTDLLGAFLEPLARFAGIYEPPPSLTADAVDDSALDTAVWRSIPLERTKLRTGFSQLHEFEGQYQGNHDFFSTADTQNTDAGSQSVRDDFYEHSLRVHDIPSSQLPDETGSTAVSSFDTTYDDSREDSLQTTSFSTQGDRTLGIGTSHLSDLEDLPNATYLKSISPQTMSVNLIVGVISVAEPRAVRTRWGTSKSLVELLVGDETKSGFSITFWLSQDSRSSTDQTLKSLRRQDIILLRNVALSDFMQKVHGHSLRKDLTKIDLLYRRKLDEGDIGGFYSTRDLASRRRTHPQLLKTRRVRDWVLNFVGGGGTSLGKRKEKGKTVRSWEMPPPDTQ